MNILNTELVKNYTSSSQKIRVMTELWAEENIFCPMCWDKISKYQNNNPVGDFACKSCREDFELKSKNGAFGKKIVDWAYQTMITRLNSAENPNFFWLNYSASYEVRDFFVIPKHYFIPEIIEKRKPLASTARRAGWVGCNILLEPIPESGKIFYIQDWKNISKSQVLENWNKTKFLRETSNLQTKWWLLDTLKCIDMLEKDIFSLKDLYMFEKHLQQLHPENNHIPDKIRQQLQNLIIHWYIERLENGIYKKL